MSVIPLYEQDQPFFSPAFEVRFSRGSGAAEQPLPDDVVRDVSEVTFHDSIDTVDTFTLLLNNWDSDARTPLFIGSGDQSRLEVVQPGNTIQLLMGYQGQTPDFRVMTTGMITTLEADFPDGGVPRLTVSGKSVLEHFRKKQFTWAWPESGTAITESEVAEDLKRQPDSPQGRPGLGFPVRTNPDARAAERRSPVPYIMMSNQYPIVFLMQLARRRGYDLFLGRDENAPANDPGYLYFGPSDRVADTTYELHWGKSLVSFKPTISLARQVKKVTVLGWDRVRKQPIRGEATLEEVPLNRDLHQYIDLTGREEVITDLPVHTQAEAEGRARDLLLAQVLDMVEGTGVTVGLPDLRAGRSVQIGNLSPTLNGRWFIKETTHTINENGYRTTFVARRENR